MASVDWPLAIKPLIKKYCRVKHPLNYRNPFELLVMVVLSAQDSDAHINTIAPSLFQRIPNMAALAKVSQSKLTQFLKGVRNAVKKSKWLIEIGKSIKLDKNIPSTLDQLVLLPGIGRKSANVFLRETKRKPEGVIVDLHVVRVAPRIGIASGTDPKKIEQEIMKKLPQKYWDAGMAMSFLGRQICRPKNPKCPECMMKRVCFYYKNQVPKK